VHGRRGGGSFNASRADYFGCDFTQLALPGARMASFVYA